MALTQKNQLLIAYKKLLGKTHTNAKFGTSNESISSNVQVGFSTVFSDTIPTSPSSSIYSITNGIVEKVTFSLVSISLSEYASTVGNLSSNTSIDKEGETETSGLHAYKLVLPSNYQTNSSNPKKGTAPFTNSYTASDSNGTLQLVPPTYDSAYAAQVSSSSGIILESQDEDYVLDYYSGILFLQDISRIPTSVDAYVYIGNYAKDRISIPQITGSVGVSGTIGQFNTLSASTAVISNQFTASSAYITNDIYIGGTASIGQLNTLTQNTLKIGDKFITLMSGAADHTTLSGSGILWGSGSVGATVDEYGANAHIVFDSITDLLEVFPGLKTSVITASSISSSNYVGLNVGSISGVSTAVWGLMTGSSNITVTNGTSSLNSNVSITQVTGTTGISGALGLYTNLTGTNISGSRITYTTITGSSISSSNYLGLTGSSANFPNFTNDVRAQISGGTGIVINSGAISASSIPNASLQNNSITVGTTSISLGGTSTTLGGLTSVTSSFISASSGIIVNHSNSVGLLTIKTNDNNLSGGLNIKSSNSNVDLVVTIEPSPSDAGKIQVKTLGIPSTVGTGNYKLLLNPEGGDILIGNISSDKTFLYSPQITASGKIQVDNNITIGNGNSSLASNIAIGFQALNSANSTNANNIAIGYQALSSSVAPSAENNGNVAIGNLAGKSMNGNDGGIFIGYKAGELCNSNYSVAIGSYALSKHSQIGNQTNFAIGSRALQNLVDGAGNYILGVNSAAGIVKGDSNLAIGTNTLGPFGSNITASNNVAIGAAAMGGPFGEGGNSTNNTAIGVSAMINNTIGSYNAAIGASALYSNRTGSYSTAIGYNSLPNLQTGSQNIAIGYNSAINVKTGSNNVYIGSHGGEDNKNNNIYLSDGAGNLRLQIDQNGVSKFQNNVEVTGILKVTTQLSASSISASTYIGLPAGGAGTVNTGQQGYIAYYPSLGTTVDDTSNIYTDGINVGISTTSVSGFKLNVNGTISGSTIHGNGGGLVSIPNGALQNSTITINGVSTALGSTANVGTITSVGAGNGLTGGGSSGAVTLNVSGAANGGIQVNADSIQVDGTVLRTTSNYVSSIAGTTNQIIASTSTGNVTLSTPQDIATTSDVTFNTVSASANIGASVSVRNGLYSRNTPRAWVKAYRTAINTLSAASTGGFNIHSLDGSQLSNGIVYIYVHNNYDPASNYRSYAVSLTIEDPSEDYYNNNIVPVVIQARTYTFASPARTRFAFRVVDAANAGVAINLNSFNPYFNFIMFAPPDNNIS